MLTLDKFQEKLNRMGVGVDSAELPQLLLDYSENFSHKLNVLTPIGNTKKLYRLPSFPVIDNSLFVRSGLTAEVFENAPVDLVVAIFDYTNPPLVQIEDVLYDPAFGVVSLLVVPGDTEVIEFSGQALNVDTAIQDILFEDDIQNPISRMKKGSIEIQTRSKIQQMLDMQKLKTANGDFITVINTTRYSTGIVKGQRTDI